MEITGTKFQNSERVLVMPLKLYATVVKQEVCYDSGEQFWGNVHLLYDDGTTGISNSWQLQKVIK